MKRALFMAPTWMGLGLDIKKGLENCGYIVDELSYRTNRFDPNNVRADIKIPHFVFKYKSKKYWTNLLGNPRYNHNYDLFFVVDGEQLSPVLFEILRARNKEVRCVNYLYDTIKGVYRYDKMFAYFDDVFSFDQGECKQFGIKLLPIYWTPTSVMKTLDYKVFGFGTYSEFRYQVFNRVKNILDNEGIPNRIQLYFAEIKNLTAYKRKLKLRKLLNRPVALPVERYGEPIIVNETIKTNDFNDIICNVDVVLDTSPLHQDGLTARFMWALGAGKKIITTNPTAKQYPFYSPEQIYCLDITNVKDKEIIDFVNSDASCPTYNRCEIDKYRIDNWLKNIIEI